MIPRKSGLEPKVTNAARWAIVNHRHHYAGVRVISRIRSFCLWSRRLVPISKGQKQFLIFQGHLMGFDTRPMSEGIAVAGRITAPKPFAEQVQLTPIHAI